MEFGADISLIVMCPHFIWCYTEKVSESVVTMPVTALSLPESEGRRTYESISARGFDSLQLHYYKTLFKCLN